MTKAERAFTEAFDRARTVSVPMAPLDPAELADRAGPAKRLRPWTQWLAVAAALALIGGVIFGVVIFGGRSVPAVPAAAPSSSLDGIVGLTFNATEIGGVATVPLNSTKEPSLAFLATSTYRAAGVCTFWVDSYRINGDQLMLGMSSPQPAVGCADDQLQEQLLRFIEAVRATRTGNLVGDVLTLRDEKGAVVMVLQADRTPNTSSLPSTEEPVVAPSAETDPISRSRELPDAPAAVTERAGRFNCGDLTLDQGERPSTEALNCLTGHLGSVDAELAVSRLTVEGDPIVTFYIVKADAKRIEAYTSNHWDAWAGSRQWQHSNCALVAATDWQMLGVCGS